MRRRFPIPCLRALLLRPIGIFALPFDRGAGNGIGYGVRSTWVLLEVIRSGDVIKEERRLTFALFFQKGHCFAQEIGTELSQVPIRSGQNSTFAVFHADPLHFRMIGKGPAVVTQVNSWLGVERIFGVSGYAEEFVEAVMGGTVQNRFGEIDVPEIKLVGRLPVAVVEIHADMVFSDSRGGRNRSFSASREEW